MDATLLLTSPVDCFIDSSSFYTGRRIGITDNTNVPQGIWTSYLFGGTKHNPLFLYLYEMLLGHLEKEGRFVDYFMLDYFFTVAYENFGFVNKLVQQVPPVSPRLHEMVGCLNKAFDDRAYKNLTEELPFHKLTYKIQLQEETKEGQTTYYAYLKKIYL